MATEEGKNIRVRILKGMKELRERVESLEKDVALLKKKKPPKIEEPPDPDDGDGEGDEEGDDDEWP